jgi:hypothetical protein
MGQDGPERAAEPSFAAARMALLDSFHDDQLPLYLSVLQKWSRYLGELEDRVVALESATGRLRTGLSTQIVEVEEAVRRSEGADPPGRSHPSHDVHPPVPEASTTPSASEPPNGPAAGPEPYVLAGMETDDLERLIEEVEDRGERLVVLRPPMTVTILQRYLRHPVALQPDGDSVFTTTALVYPCRRVVHADGATRRGYHLVDLLALLGDGAVMDDDRYESLCHHLPALTTVRHTEIREHVLARARWRLYEPVDERALFRQLQAAVPGERQELERDLATLTANAPALARSVEVLLRPRHGLADMVPRARSPRPAPSGQATNAEEGLSPRMTVFARHLGNGDYHRLPEIDRFSASLGLSLADAVEELNTWAAAVAMDRGESLESPVIQVDDSADEVWVDARLKELVASAGF